MADRRPMADTLRRIYRFGVASPFTLGDTLCIRPSAWISILLALLFSGCPCVVSLKTLSSRAGYSSLYRITGRNRQGVRLNGQESTRRTPGRSVAIAMTPRYLSCPGITQPDSFYPWASVPPRILDPFPTCSLISTPWLSRIPPPDLPTGCP